MEKILLAIIEQECRKHIERHYEYLFHLQDDVNRKERRLGTTIPKEVKKPSYWKINNGFNPFWVLSKKQLHVYAHTLAQKLKNQTYKPKTSIIQYVPKIGGGQRELNIFQLADSALSLFFYKELLRKNTNRLSAYAYAYREDRNAHDAIMRISTDWSNVDRIYVAEFDFSKFFDNISHDYLLRTLENNGFLYTDLEEYVVKCFLASKKAEQTTYNQNSEEQRTKGIPQGTSLSLFLANLACWELDQELESIGVKFARYADDTLVWSNSYEKIVQAYDTIDHFSKLMQVPVNMEKSEGIALLAKKVSSEIKTKESVRFLGYQLTLEKVSIGQSSVPNIKARISYLIYQNLLQPLKTGIYNKSRLDNLDWDYIVALMQVRRYLYGGLTDEKLRHFKLGIINHLNFRGVMSYYPLVNDEKQLKQLDGWLIHTFRQTLKLRQNLWVKHSKTLLPGPNPNWIDEISHLKEWVSPIGEVIDLRIPSFLLINEAIKMGLKKGGIVSVNNPKSIYYSSYLAITTP